MHIQNLDNVGPPGPGVHTVAIWLQPARVFNSSESPFCVGRGDTQTTIGLTSSAFQVVEADGKLDCAGQIHCKCASGFFYVHIPRTGGSTIIAAMPACWRERFYGPAKLENGEEVLLDHLTIPDLIRARIASPEFSFETTLKCIKEHIAQQ